MTLPAYPSASTALSASYSRRQPPTHKANDGPPPGEPPRKVSHSFEGRPHDSTAVPLSGGGNVSLRPPNLPIRYNYDAHSDSSASAGTRSSGASSNNLSHSQPSSLTRTTVSGGDAGSHRGHSKTVIQDGSRGQHHSRSALADEEANRETRAPTRWSSSVEGCGSSASGGSTSRNDPASMEEDDEEGGPSSGGDADFQDQKGPRHHHHHHHRVGDEYSGRRTRDGAVAESPPTPRRSREVRNEPSAQAYTADVAPFPMPLGVRVLVTSGGELHSHGGELDRQASSRHAAYAATATAVEKEKQGETQRQATLRQGKLRCYWALLTTPNSSSNTQGRGGGPIMLGRPTWSAPSPSTSSSLSLRFLHLDPVLGAHLEQQSSSLVGCELLDLVHPDDRESTAKQLGDVVRNQDLFGSAVRCRFSRLARIRAVLGAYNPGVDADEDAVSEDVSGSRDFVAMDLVANFVGEGLVLAFFHAVLDKHASDNDPAQPTDWSNWCGTPEHAFSRLECEKIWHQLNSSLERPTASTGPTHVLQILTAEQPPRLLFSWPPPRLFPPDTAQSVLDASGLQPFYDGSYFADDFARLGRGINLAAPSGASTSCTRRFKARHTLNTEGLLRSIESVIVPYGAVVLACYRVNSSRRVGHQAVAPPSPPPRLASVAGAAVEASQYPAPSHKPAAEYAQESTSRKNGRLRKNSAPDIAMEENLKRQRTKRAISDADSRFGGSDGGYSLAARADRYAKGRTLYLPSSVGGPVSDVGGRALPPPPSYIGGGAGALLSPALSAPPGTSFHYHQHPHYHPHRYPRHHHERSGFEMYSVASPSPSLSLPAPEEPSRPYREAQLPYPGGAAIQHRRDSMAHDTRSLDSLATASAAAALEGRPDVRRLPSAVASDEKPSTSSAGFRRDGTSVEVARRSRVESDGGGAFTATSSSLQGSNSAQSTRTTSASLISPTAVASPSTSSPSASGSSSSSSRASGRDVNTLATVATLAAAAAAASSAPSGASSTSSGAAPSSNAASNGGGAGASRRCLSCGTTNSPEWRKGPAGPKTLCNSCGIRESRKRRKVEALQRERAAHAQQQQQHHHHHHHHVAAASANAMTMAVAPGAEGAEQPPQRLPPPSSLSRMAG